MTRRAEFTRTTKDSAWRRDRGQCQRCFRKLFPGDHIEYDHIIRCEMQDQPDNSLENCQTLCGWCHGMKTHLEDAPAAAKSRSVRAKHIGAHKPARPMPGSRASGLKKPLNRNAIPRN